MRLCRGADAAFENLEDAPLHTPDNLFQEFYSQRSSCVVGVVEAAKSDGRAF
jgi:hypothetical protein